MDLRKLILFTNTTSTSIGSEEWIQSQMVIHIFTIQNSVIWKANTTVTQGEMMLNTVAGMSYNTHAKRGVLVGHLYNETDPSYNCTA